MDKITIKVTCKNCGKDKEYRIIISKINNGSVLSNGRCSCPRCNSNNIEITDVIIEIVK